MKKVNLLLLVLLFSSITSFSQRVIGYYAGWSIDYWDIQYDKLTDINYSFAEPKTNNTMGFSDAFQEGLFTDFLNYAQNVQTLNPNIRINISIGGADQNLADRFHTIGASTSRAQTFAKSVVDFCLLHNLDGVDIDWEPLITSSSNSFTTLVRELRTEIDNRAPQLQLSAAVFPEGFVGNTGIPNGGVTSASFQYMDYFNLMVYDYGTPDFASHSPADRAAFAVDYWQNTKGLSKSKMVLGLPFYGRSSYWAYSRNDQTPYSNLVATYGGATAAGSDAAGNWRYNGQTTIQNKTSYAINNGLKGVMIWEISQDVNGQYSLLNSIDAAINAAGCPKPDLGASQIICGQQNIALQSGLDALTTTFVWKKNNQVLSGQTGANYTATSGGTYEVSATKNGTNCTKTDIISIIDQFDAPDLGNGVPLCGTETVDVDADLGIPGLTYQWKKGATTVSNVSLLSFNTTGTYDVTVTDPFGHCSSQTASLDASPSALSLTGDAVCNGDEATLTIQSTGGPYSWFAAQNGGALLNVGNEYKVTPANTTTYYVQNTGGSQTKFVGLTERGSGTAFGAYITYNPEFVMQFTANQALTIDSVTVFPDWTATPKSFNVELISGMTVTGGKIDANSGTIVTTKTLTYSNDGGLDVPVRFALGLQITTPGTYFLRIVNPDVVIFQGQMSDIPFGDPGYVELPYPFAFDNVMTIETSYSWGGWEDRRTYAGLYNWRISTGATCPRVPVTATVNNCTPPTATIQVSANSTLENEAITITATGTDADGTIDGMSISQDGVIIQEGVTNQGGGVYTLDLAFGVEGSYDVCAVATDNDGKQSAAACETITVTKPNGIENTLAGKVAIFPNPFSGSAQLELAISESVQVNVYNAGGVLIDTFAAQGTVSLGDNYQKGLYLLEIISSEGVLKSQIIKE